MSRAHHPAGAEKPADDLTELAPSVQLAHFGAVKVARWVQRIGSPPERSEPLVRSAGSPALVTYADRFGQLQRWRHDADYDHRKIIDRAVAIGAVRSAREAIEALDTAWGEPGWTAFCTLMLMHGTGRSGP